MVKTGPRRPRAKTKLRRGGDMHSVLKRIVEAGGVGDHWVDPDVACRPVMPATRRYAIGRLASNAWIEEDGGKARATPEGLLALENAW